MEIQSTSPPEKRGGREEKGGREKKREREKKRGRERRREKPVQKTPEERRIAAYKMMLSGLLSSLEVLACRISQQSTPAAERAVEGLVYHKERRSAPSSLQEHKENKIQFLQEEARGASRFLMYFGQEKRNNQVRNIRIAINQ